MSDEFLLQYIKEQIIFETLKISYIKLDKMK